jgi:HKD family nuclease
MSGLKLLLPTIKKRIKAGCALHIIVGPYFGLTEPDALELLMKLFEHNKNCYIYLDLGKTNTAVFHPKLYLFKNNTEVNILSGSANITSGGLVGNNEVSTLVTTKSSNAVWKDAFSYMQNILLPENADIVTPTKLNIYRQHYEKQKRFRKGQKATADKKSYDFAFDLVKLKEDLADFKDKEFIADFKERKKSYKKAKDLLDEIVDSKSLSQNRYQEIIEKLVGKAGQEKYWKSGSMFRGKTSVFKYKNEFRQLVKIVKENQNKQAAEVYSMAKEQVGKIHRAGINYVTEIMMTYQPQKFANLNGNPIKVLKEEAGVYIKATSESFNGNDYQEYCNITEEIRIALDLENMLEVDSFFNEIYWEIKYNRG